MLAVVGLVGAAGVGWFVLAAGRATPTTPLGPPAFVEETSRAGLEQTYDGPLAYFTGGGVATFDCDDDGRLDAYVSGGTAEAAPVPQRAVRSAAASASHGRRRRSTDLTAVTGAYPLDVDGDDIVDLVVLRSGVERRAARARRLPFERASERLGLGGGASSTMAFSATWEG